MVVGDVDGMGISAPLIAAATMGSPGTWATQQEAIGGGSKMWGRQLI